MNGCHCLYVCLQLLLSLAGLLSVGMSIGFAYGLATTFGVIYGPVHAIMPFLLLGKRTHIHVLWLTSICFRFTKTVCYLYGKDPSFYRIEMLFMRFSESIFIK